MTREFQKCFDNVLVNEGCMFTDHPLDRGGPTKFGITLQTLVDWRERPCDAEDVENLTYEEAAAIYYDRYWLPMRLDRVTHLGLRNAIFDQCVNRGNGAVARQIQRMVNVPVDGYIGPVTLKAINEKLSFYKFVCACQVTYVRIVQKNPSQLAFLVGWIRRTQAYLREWL